MRKEILHGSKGIWLGRDTEADENIVFNGIEVVKARTIKRNFSSAQWDRELFLTLASTPWDPKGKTTEDKSFVLPPALTVTGKMRPPPGLTAPEGSEDTQDVLPEDQGMKTEAFENLPDIGSDLRRPEASRSESTKRTATDLDELPEEL